MRVFINNKGYELIKDGLFSNYVDVGNEGKIYRVGDKAVKVYGDICFKRRLGPTAVDIMSEIPTERILLPQDKVFDEYGNFCGYTSKFINSKYFDYNTFLLKDYLEEYKRYEQDIEILNQHQIETGDMTIYNLVYSDGFYMVDSGSFGLSELEYSAVKKINEQELRRLFIQLLVFCLSSEGEAQKVSKMVDTNADFYNSILNNMDNEYETVNSYSLKLLNRR